MPEAWEFKISRKCAHCRKTFRPRTTEQVFCRTECHRVAWFKRAAVDAAKRGNPVPDKHRGGWGELIASAWLLAQGYEVFRNVSAMGPIDLVAIRDSKTLLIDVKLVQMNVTKAGEFRAKGPRLKPEQRVSGVIPLYVSSDGVCSFTDVAIADSYSKTLNKALDESGVIR